MIPILIAAGVGTIFVVGIVKLMWRVAEPNEALIISGLRAYRNPDNAVAESLGFKIVTGKGVLVMPGGQNVRRLSLDLQAAQLSVDCVTQQGIPVGVRGVVIFKVGDDYASIANAARRFLDQQNKMEARVHNVFAGHLRAMVGQLTIEDMIRDREKLTALTRASSGTEMQKLGLIVDSLQIQEIDDPTGYIKNLGRPHVAAVASLARIAEAQADREATEQEQIAAALKAEAARNSAIKQSGFQAEVDEAAARAQQAGPLAEATAHQQVVVEQTKVAQLEGDREEQRLQATVRKPADARAYEQTTLARASRDAQISAAEASAQETTLVAAAQAESTRIIGDADAHARRAIGEADAATLAAKGLAAAEAIRARADALSVNQDAVIGQQLAEQWPAIVEAAAKPFGDVDQMILLNGATGIAELLTQALSQGSAGLQLARSLLSGQSQSGQSQSGQSQSGQAPAGRSPADNGSVSIPAPKVDISVPKSATLDTALPAEESDDV
ncbi:MULTISPECIES: flotillin family protein [unclassified Frankia]|uniref:flotillin family protein n=1 Tax=unclassified Frankia TaxID=2632575 RepID=UPI002AD59DE5|nr:MULTISPECIES: SPFH domain-containing protein [unclassified Frankia]